MTRRNYDMAELKRLDIAHHLPAQASYKLIRDIGGSRVIVRAEGSPVGIVTAMQPTMDVIVDEVGRGKLRDVWYINRDAILAVWQIAQTHLVPHAPQHHETHHVGRVL